MNNPQIQRYLARHESMLERIILSADIPAPRIKDAFIYCLCDGGKRIRPLLVYGCGELVDADIESLDIIAAAIECMHCYSLVHDDLPAMDDDDLRRGKPSCHRAFDEATAILVGDGLQALSIDLLLSRLPNLQPSSTVLLITHELVKAAGASGMISGQSLDLSELSSPDITEQRLKDIHMLKTGRLIMACINMVLPLTHANEHIKETLRQLSTDLGLVFQMQDDYLDRYHDDGDLGKGRASDLANQKTTFANIYKKDELLTRINQYFQRIHQSLKPFPDKSQTLLTLITMLQHRINGHQGG